ncbi:MAG: ABC transporter permease [Chloroflexi bacterium]|nr:ABC transporter permease [Chloroflexota bacterium]
MTGEARTAAAPLVLRRGEPLSTRAWRLARAKPLGAVAALLVLLLVLTAIFADVVAPHDFLKQYPALRLAPPGIISPEGKPYILGGDEVGRDLFARLVHGARASLVIGLGATSIGILLGSLLGLLSGYVEGRFDLALQRIMDIKMSIPGLILAMLLVVVLPKSGATVALAIGLSAIPNVNRVVRAATLSRKQNQYVEAARAMGAGHLRIMSLHILPNVLAPIIILATTAVGGAILVEASLSFLGLGTAPPTPSWGRMISDAGRIYIIREPRLLIAPSVALSLAILGLNLAGDALRDILDPRLRGTEKR